MNYPRISMEYVIPREELRPASPSCRCCHIALKEVNAAGCPGELRCEIGIWKDEGGTWGGGHRIDYCLPCGREVFGRLEEILEET